MKPEQLYLELKALADKLGVSVEEHNFRNTGVRVKSGACLVRGKQLVIIDKHKALSKKIRILASILAGFSHEDVFIIPAVRDLLGKYAHEANREEDADPIDKV
jgi:hypothetical protein